MLLVKSAAELEALENMTPAEDSNGEKGQSTGIMHVLEYCGVPKHWGDKPDEHQGGTDELMSALKGGL
jgi:hypothetical protein